jgi:hypothetical protein
MICRHVLTVLDAGPFVDGDRAELLAARQHAAACPTCGRAQELLEELSHGLGELPQPALPPGFCSAIVTRLKAVQRVGSDGFEEAAQEEAERMTAPSWRWGTGLGGLVAGLAFAVDSMRMTEPHRTTLLAGLILYALGLFAPLRETTRTRFSRPPV